MVDIKSELKSNQTILFVMSSGEYNENIVSVIKKLSGNICYITTNKTFYSLKEIFLKKKIEIGNIVFIDTISKAMMKIPDQSEDVYYVSSPGALTELSLVIKKFLKHDFDYLVFDAVTNLLTYQDNNMCNKFLADLVDKVKRSKTRAIFYAVESSNNEDLIAKVGTVVDKVIRGKFSKSFVLSNEKIEKIKINKEG
ncbi:hypothetical protein J4226_00555 [Candidatus Pacearchaeota archaeon]|nr:hypothetical protein [Candidatus Pacearchaeota archaeon]